MIQDDGTDWFAQNGSADGGDSGDWFAQNGVVSNPNGVGLGTGIVPPQQSQASIQANQQANQQSQGGWDRQAFRDASMSRPVGQTAAEFIAQHPEFSQGVQSYQGSKDKYILPTGEVIDLSINSDAQGHGTANGWTGTGFNAQGVPDVPGGGQQGAQGQMGQLGFSVGGYGGGGGYGGSGAVTMPNAPDLGTFNYQPNTMGQFQGPQAYNAPSPFSYGGPQQQGQMASGPRTFQSANGVEGLSGIGMTQQRMAGSDSGPQTGGLDPISGTAPRPAQSSGSWGDPSGNVPTPERVNYNPMTNTGPVAPTLNYQQLQTPQAFQPSQQLGYNAMQTPQTFQGDRQGSAQQTNYNAAIAPSDFGYQQFTAPTEAEAANDPGNQYAINQTVGALQNSAAAKGILQSKNFATGINDQVKQLTSQQYGDAYNRALTSNQANNSGRLGAYQTNATTQLGYNQANNQGQLSANQANNAANFNVNESNYGRGSTESQQGFQNAFAVNQANNAGQNAAIQGNTTNAMNAANLNSQNALNFGQANNANALQFGQQNINNAQQGFQNQFQVNQANNLGNAAATQSNNASALAAQGQGYGQAANTWGMNQAAQQSAQNQNFNQAAASYGLNQGANQQAYNQSLGAYQANTGNQLALYGAQSNNALGLGNLNLGYQNSNNAYSLGQGNLALGQQQAANSYALGQGNLALGYGNLGVSQGQLGLQQQGQQYNQAANTYGLNYNATVTQPWNQYLQLAQLGNPGAANGLGYSQQATNTIEGQGNAQAAGQVGSANAQNAGMAGAANSGMQAYYAWLAQQPQQQGWTETHGFTQ